MYDPEGILEPLNEHLAGNLVYLSTIHRYMLLFMINWALGGKSVHLVDENSERLIGEFIKVWQKRKRQYLQIF